MGGLSCLGEVNPLPLPVSLLFPPLVALCLCTFVFEWEVILACTPERIIATESGEIRTIPESFGETGIRSTCLIFVNPVWHRHVNLLRKTEAFINFICERNVVNRYNLSENCYLPIIFASNCFATICVSVFLINKPT